MEFSKLEISKAYENTDISTKVIQEKADIFVDILLSSFTDSVKNLSGYYKIRCNFEEKGNCKNYQISITFCKKDTSLKKLVNKLISKCNCLLFRVTLIKRPLKSILTDGHFIFCDNPFLVNNQSKLNHIILAPNWPK